MKKLLTIYDAFEVDNKGTVATGISDKEVIELIAGTEVTLKTPSGVEFRLKAIAVEHFTKCFTDAIQLGILFGNQIKANDIPRETELWQ